MGEESGQQTGAWRGGPARLFLMVLLFFGVVLGAIAVAAWMFEGESTIPFEYEGFD